MENEYDICVSNDTLLAMENNINLIIFDIEKSNEQMLNAIQASDGFLAGRQYEKARQTTKICRNVSEKTISNLRNAKEYLKNLQEIVSEYCQCGYRGA